MGRGRARAAAIAGLIGTIALVVGGCGESRHSNEQRPHVSTRVSVTINDREVVVQPRKVGLRAERLQEIPQNQNHPEPPLKTKGPLDVTFVAANQTDSDLRLALQGVRGAKSDTIFAHSPGTFQVDLPAGSYVISAAGIPGAKPARLEVGSYRASSQNDVLLP
jgi:hypothetical protein